MKLQRTLAITLTVALFGGLMFMGFAGTAAAQENVDDGIAIDFGDQQTGDAVNVAEINQDNTNQQIGEATAVAEAGTAHHKYHGGTAVADATVAQDQTVDQTNFAEVDQTAETGDAIQEVNIDAFVNEG